MAKKRSTKKKSRTKTTRTDWRERLSIVRSPIGRNIMVAAGWVILIGAIAGAWFFGVPKLQEAAADRLVSDHIELTFRDPPAWVNEDLLASLQRNALRDVIGDPFLQSDLEHIQFTLTESGWFDEIKQVRRLSATHVEVDARFSRPFAVVRDGVGDHLIDPVGTLLPHVYETGGARGFTVITGAAFDRPPRPGRQWDGSDITAALRVLRLIDRKPWRDQVAAIDVRDYAAVESIVLVTNHGSRIVWGSAPGEEPPGEASAERKISYLDHHVEQMGRIDFGRPEVSITSPNYVSAPRSS
jgi:hypothetical protein